MPEQIPAMRSRTRPASRTVRGWLPAGILLGSVLLKACAESDNWTFTEQHDLVTGGNRSFIVGRADTATGILRGAELKVYCSGDGREVILRYPQDDSDRSRYEAVARVGQEAVAGPVTVYAVELASEDLRRDALVLDSIIDNRVTASLESEQRLAIQLAESAFHLGTSTASSAVWSMRGAKKALERLGDCK